jgi:cobalt-zinc-cadmium efflux system outer membrane protein
MRLKILPILLLLAMPTLDASPLSVESLVQTALANNRDLQAAQFALAQAQGRLAQAGRWPNPELELSGLSEVAFRNDGAGAFTVGLNQTFPLTTRLSLAREAGRLDVLRAMREIRNHERLLIAKVRQTSIQILESNAQSKVLAELLAAADASAKLTQQRLEAGQGSISEKSLSLLEQRRIANELESARMDRDLAMLELKTLLGLSAKEPLAISDTLEGIVKKLSPLANARPESIHRPDVDLLLLESEKAGIENALAKAEAWEGVRIGVEYAFDQNMDEPEGLGTDNFLGLSVSVPLPVWDQKKGLAEERAALRDENLARARAAKLEIENALASSLRAVQLLQNRLAEFDTRTLEPITTALAEMQSGYETGRVDLRDLFTLREQLGKLRLERVALEGRLASALGDLETTTGSHPAIRREYLVPSNKTSKNP